MKSTTDILKERGAVYGEFSDNALVSRCLKEAMQASNNWATLSYEQKEALDMIAHKIARILSGDPNYHDSWVDIAGYATLVANTLGVKQ